MTEDAFRDLATPTLSASESLVLRPVELDDAEEFLELVRKNFDRLTAWLNIVRVPSTVEERRKLLATDMEPTRTGDRHWWMIEWEGKLAGTIDVHAIQKRPRWGLVGYWLGDQFTGRGLMTESLRAVTDWAFTELGLTRLEIQSSIENRASCGVPERLGIGRESIRRQSNVINGTAHDMASYVALADNWPPKQPDKPLPQRTVDVDEGLRLRPVSADDQQAMWSAIDTGRDYLGEYLPWINEYPSEAAHTSGFRKRLFEQDFYDRSGNYVVEYRGELAGTAGFHVPNRDNGLEIGYWLREDLQGQGIMTKCVAALIDITIFQMGVHRVVIRAATSNAGSRGIPERLGFKHEGTLREAGFVNNQYLDLEIYSMLDYEWLRRSSKA
ncbi:MAG: GNAT family N-acetyltransferase [Chloroflexi bacterium]|nr:GNAT family N-acetyltransferase [Chloroflexota bacterium]